MVPGILELDTSGEAAAKPAPGAEASLLRRVA
jgi:hypothetical protein